MGIFEAAHGWGERGGKKAPLPKNCHTYPTMMKLGTVIPNLKKIQKIYASAFFKQNQQILLYQERQI